MKIACLLCVIFLFITHGLFAEKIILEQIEIDGEIYKNVEVVDIKPDGIVVMYQFGGAKIFIDDLSDELKERFDLSDNAAREYKKEREEQAQKREEQQAIKGKEAEDWKKKQELIKTIKLLEDNYIEFKGEFSYNPNTGGCFLTTQGFKLADSYDFNYRDSYYKKIYVPDLTPQASGEHWNGILYPTGRMTNGQNPVRVFCTSTEEALKYIHDPELSGLSVEEVIKNNPSHWYTAEGLRHYYRYKNNH